MQTLPNFVKNYTIGCANSQKSILLGALIYKLTNYTAECAIFIHKGLHLKITETACVPIAGLKNKL